MDLATIDWVIMLVYFAFVLGIGFVLKRDSEPARTFSCPAVPFPHGSPGWRSSPPTWARRK